MKISDYFFDALAGISISQTFSKLDVKSPRFMKSVSNCHHPEAFGLLSLCYFYRFV